MSFVRGQEEPEGGLTCAKGSRDGERVWIYFIYLFIYLFGFSWVVEKVKVPHHTGGHDQIIVRSGTTPPASLSDSVLWVCCGFGLSTNPDRTRSNLQRKTGLSK